MKTADFDFDLPEIFIAAYPSGERDRARLMRLDRSGDAISDHTFAELESLLPRGSLLVVNDSRVIPARLHGVRKTASATASASGGTTADEHGARVELLLVRRLDAGASAPGGDARLERAAPGTPPGAELWEAIGRNLGRLEPGAELDFPERLRARFVAREEGGGGRVQVLMLPPPGLTLAEALEVAGEVPIPPYIAAARRRGEDRLPSAAARRAEQAFDRERYQTVYASPPGSVAAPTAGLHFTERLLAEVTAAGHQVATISLHVGLGTFRPVKSETVEGHAMDPETYTIPEATAALLWRARGEGRPVVAVGTTVVRALESAARARPDRRVVAGTSSSRLFLVPGAEFHVVTDLVTNFHLPRSTLLMLVSAFAGREAVLRAYEAAKARGYRFYSYGDAMLIRGTR